jgi:hypothetical protein
MKVTSPCCVSVFVCEKSFVASTEDFPGHKLFRLVSMHRRLDFQLLCNPPLHESRDKERHIRVTDSFRTVLRSAEFQHPSRI